MRKNKPQTITRRPSVLPLVSVVIAAEPAQPVEEALRALAASDYPRGRIEVLVCRGRNPSYQRNLGAARARGEYVLFLDSDSRVGRGLIRSLLACLADAGVAAAGGPDLPVLPQTFLQSCFDLVQSTWFGSFSSRARYRSLGGPRDSGESELILCNLMVRRHDFIDSKGFRTGLYPNEENEWLDRMRGAGRRARYQPDAAVRRPRHRNLPAFARQAFRYGRGRTRQMMFSRRLNPVHLTPALFLAYLGMMPFLPAAWWPLGLYLTLDVFFAARASYGRPLKFMALLLLYPLRHLSYGLGTWAGLAFSGKRPEGHVEIAPVRLAGRGAHG